MVKITEPWKFEEFDAERSNSSGDIVSLLRNNEDYQWPGILGENAPPTMSSTLARESLKIHGMQPLSDEMLLKNQELTSMQNFSFLN